MQPRHLFFVLGAALTMVNVAPLADASEPWIGSARAFSGDTLIIRGAKIRLHGIKAPTARQTCGTEPGWPCGQASKSALEARLGDGDIHCELRHKVGHGYWQARCLTEAGTDLAAVQARDGWAHAVPDMTMDYVDAESHARAEAIGLWRQDRH